MGMKKEMATHASTLAWRIPGMGEPDGLPSMGSHRVGHDWSDLAAAAADTCKYCIHSSQQPCNDVYCYPHSTTEWMKQRD